MNTFLWSCAAVLTLFVTVESLTCNTCDVSILGYCFGSKPVNCSSAEDKCYSAVAKFSADLLDIHARGCANTTVCSMTKETGSILTINYTVTRTCCNTTLCNGAAPTQLPLTAALSGVMVAVWSQWGL